MEDTYSYSFSFSQYQSYSVNATRGDDLPVIIPLIISYSLVFLVGVSGNLIVLFSIYRSRRLHTITCIFLANLAIVDLMVCLVVVPIQIGQEFFSHWPYGAALCKLTSYLMMVNPACSVFTLTLISFERFYGVLYPLKARSVLTFRRAKGALIVVWLSACVFAVPNIFKQSTKPKGDTIVCSIGWEPYSTEYRIYVTCNLLFLLVIPAAMMTITYSFVIRALYKNKEATAGRKQSSSGRPSTSSSYNGRTRLEVVPHEDDTSSSTLASDYSPARVLNMNNNLSPVRCPIKDTSPTRDIGRNTNHGKRKAKRLRFVLGGDAQQRDTDSDKVKRIVQMLIVIVILFVICWSPLLVTNFLLKFALIHPDYTTLIILSSTTHLLAFSNSCINPFVYALLSKNFRESMKQVFRQCCRRNNRTGINHRPSLSTSRASRSGTFNPKWRNLRNANQCKEDHV